MMNRMYNETEEELIGCVFKEDILLQQETNEDEKNEEHLISPNIYQHNIVTHISKKSKTTASLTNFQTDNTNWNGT